MESDGLVGRRWSEMFEAIAGDDDKERRRRRRRRGRRETECGM